MRLEVNHCRMEGSQSIFKNLEPVKLNADRISPVVNIKTRANSGQFIRANDLFIAYPTSKNGQVRAINQKDASNVVLKAEGVNSPFTALQMEKLDSVCLLAAAVDLKLFIWQVSNATLQSVSPLVIDVPSDCTNKISAIAFKPRARTIALSVSSRPASAAEIFIYNLEFEPTIETRFGCPQPVINLQYTSSSLSSSSSSSSSPSPPPPPPSLWMLGKTRVFVEKSGKAIGAFKLSENNHQSPHEMTSDTVSNNYTRELENYDYDYSMSDCRQDSASLLFVNNGDVAVLRQPLQYYRPNGECTVRINFDTDICGATSFGLYGIIWQKSNLAVTSIDQNSKCFKDISLLSFDLDILDIFVTKNLEKRPEVAFDLYIYHSTGIGIVSVTKADLNLHSLNIERPPSPASSTQTNHLHNTSSSTEESRTPIKKSSHKQQQHQHLYHHNQANKFENRSHSLIDPEYSRELTDTRVKHNFELDIPKIEESLVKSGKFVSRRVYESTRKDLMERIDLLEKKVAFLLALPSDGSKRDLPIEWQTATKPRKGKSQKYDKLGISSTTSKESFDSSLTETSRATKSKDKSPGGKWKDSLRKSSSRGTTSSRQETPVPEEITSSLGKYEDNIPVPDEVKVINDSNSMTGSTIVGTNITESNFINSKAVNAITLESNFVKSKDENISELSVLQNLQQDQVSNSAVDNSSSVSVNSKEFEAKILELTEVAQDSERLSDLLVSFSLLYNPNYTVSLNPSDVHNQLVILSAIACISRGILNIDMQETVKSLVNWLVKLLKLLRPKIMSFQKNKFLSRVLREVMVNLEISESTDVIPVISILQDILSKKVI